MKNISKLISNPWVNFLIFSLFYFYEFTQITVFNSFSENMISSLNITTFQFANLSACYLYANIFILIPAGLMLDRMSVKSIIICTMAISILGTYLLSEAGDITHAYIFRSISGLSGGFSFICMLRVIMVWMPKKQISFAIGIMITIGFLGGIVAQVPFEMLNGMYGWRQSLKILSLFGGIFWLMILIFIRDNKQEYQHESLSTILKSLAEVIKNPQTWIPAWYISLMNLPIIVIAALWSDFLLEYRYHFNLVDAGEITSMLFLGILVGSPLVGLLSDRYKMKKTFMLSGTIMSAIIFIFIMQYAEANLTTMSILYFALGFFSSAQCLGYPLALQNNKDKNIGAASSICSIVVLGGGSLFKVLFGYMLEQGKVDGIYLASSFDMPMYMILGVFLFTLGLVFFVRDQG